MFKFFTAIGIAVVSVIGLIAVAIIWLFVSTPQPSNIKGCLTTTLFQVHLCPTDPNYVKIEQVSSAAKNAVLVSEDSAFYDHHGIDWFELQQSAEKNWKKNEFARGGSTITQQLAKNVYLSSEKSILRKVREVIITVQLEKSLTKNEILEKYLNVVEFGPNLYGIGKASRFYFGKTPSALTAAEGAFLAFLLPNPKDYSVSYRNKKLSRYAHSQMRIIVDRLHRFKKIGADEHQAAVYQVNHFYGSLSEFAKDRIDESIEPSSDEMGEDEGEVGPNGAILDHVEEMVPRESSPDDTSFDASPSPEETSPD
jgi:monofunctional biosynthetic peptidoglycan transglycosylase